MKKLVVFAMVLALCVSCACGALAAQGTFANTRAFTEKLDDINFQYSVSSIDHNGDERVMLKNKGEAFSYTINYYFNSDNDEVNIFIWDIIKFAETDYTKVLRAVNTANHYNRLVKLHVDDSDNTVTLCVDLIVREGDNVGDIVFEATQRLVHILDAVYETISVYDK